MVEILIPSEKSYVRLIGKDRAQFQNGEINGCCKQPDSLYLWHKDEENKICIWRCRVCGRHHYVMTAEPGHLGIMDAKKAIIGGAKQ